MTWRVLPAIWESDLSPLDKLVLLCLAKYSDGAGRNSKPAQDTISRLTGIGARRVRTALATLKKRGLIVPEGKGRKGTISYKINLPLANNGSSGRAGDVGTTKALGRHRESYNPVDIQLNNPINGNINFNSGFRNNPHNRTTRTTGTISITDQAQRLATERRQRT
tara:strand:+ start:243 stop:737 length:495 start_codon:yes stop_codon:yes gene_type:complete